MIVDCNAYCGHWPFRRLGFGGAAGLATLIERTGTGLALVSPLAGAFYRDCLSAVQEMLDDPGWDAGRMLPVAVVNPAFPGWRRDLDTMAGKLGCVALRLLPNYHGYNLYDEGEDSGLAVVERAQSLGLPVIMTMRMQDERSHHWHMLVESTPVDQVRFLMRLLPHGKYVLSNVWFREVRALKPELEMADDGAWEISYKPPDHMVEDAVNELGAQRLLYGSAAPLQYPECTLTVIHGAEIDDGAKAMILGGNARRLFGVEDSMPIDVHVHIGGRYDMVARNLDRGWVDTAIVSCVHYQEGEANYQPTEPDVRWCNDYTLSWMERYGGRVQGLAYINPRHGAAGRAEMERCLDRGMVGAKLLLCVFADDPRVDPFIRLAIERDVPVLAHAWVKTMGNLPYESRPQNVMRLAQRFPEAKLILAHWGGEWETGAKVLGECPNLYVDISGTPAEMDSVEGLVAAAGEDKVMFGTDNTNYFYCLGKVAGARLTDQQRRKILTDNAQRLFRL